MREKLSFADVFAELCGGGLGAATAARVFDEILTGSWTPAQIGALLAALELRGKSVEVVCAAARAMRKHMLSVDHSQPLTIDTCGTGGDGRNTLNVSTGAALLVAAAGIPVAKHGNRAASSRSGSADVLSALGIALDVPPAAQASILEKANIAFLFAPAHHPAMKHAGPTRKELGIRTLFNLLGPLANPARATHQLVGAFSDEARQLMAAALLDLGVQGAWVVHSEDGLDEISPFAPTRVTVIESGRTSERVIAPEDFGLQRSPEGAIAGGDAAENARIIDRILAGEPHPARTALLLNAAAALAIAAGVSLEQAARRAAEALESGAALSTLERWRALTRQSSPSSSTTAPA